MKKPKPIEEPEKPIKKKKNRKRWHKKKDPSSNSPSPEPSVLKFTKIPRIERDGIRRRKIFNNNE